MTSTAGEQNRPTLEKSSVARFTRGFVNFIKENLGILVALVVLCIFLAVYPRTSDSFLQWRNASNVLRQASTNLYLACGMTMVIILGGIDLSVGSVIALSGCFAAACVARYEMSIPISIVCGILIGGVVGCFNGLVVAMTTIPAFIVTLATMNIAKGLAYVYTGGSPVRVVNSEWQWIGGGYELGVPVPVWILILILIITAILMNWTRLGRHLYAVGGNPQAAEFSGINVRRVKFLVHAFTGIMAGTAGVVLASRMYSGQPSVAQNAYEMDAIAAVVVGGTSMQGGSGKIGGTIIGGLIIGVLNNGLNLMNVNSFWQYVIKGVVILLAVFIDFWRGRKASR